MNKELILELTEEFSVKVNYLMSCKEELTRQDIDWMYDISKAIEEKVTEESALSVVTE